MSRLKWSQKEEQMIYQLHQTEEIKSWVRISQRVYALNPDFKRTPKQCRDRFINFIRFKRNGQQPDSGHQINLMMLVLSFLKFGPSWKKIAQHFPQQYFTFYQSSENTLKNKMYALIRKLSIKIKSVKKPKTRRVLDGNTIKSILVDLRGKLLVCRDEAEAKNHVQMFKIFWVSIEILERGEQIPEDVLNEFRRRIINKSQSQVPQSFDVFKKENGPAVKQNGPSLSKIVSDAFQLHHIQNCQLLPFELHQWPKNPKVLVPQESRTMQNSNQRENHLMESKFNDNLYKFPKEVLQLMPINYTTPSLTAFRPNTFEDLEEEMRIIEGSKMEDKNGPQFIQ